MKITVLIADDHPIVRQGLRALLSTETDLEIVGEAEDGREAIELTVRLRPDVVLMDVAMPFCNGVTATRRILQRLPGCRVLALSTYTDDESVGRMLEAGAAGYLCKQSAPNELVKAIREVTAGMVFFSRSIASNAQRLAMAQLNGDTGKNLLEPRERDVIKLIAQGLTNREIATQLALSLPEMKYCRERVMNKLNIRNIAQLTRYALANGLTCLNSNSSVPFGESSVPSVGQDTIL